MQQTPRGPKPRSTARTLATACLAALLAASPAAADPAADQLHVLLDQLELAEADIALGLLALLNETPSSAGGPIDNARADAQDLVTLSASPASTAALGKKARKFERQAGKLVKKLDKARLQLDDPKKSDIKRRKTLVGAAKVTGKFRKQAAKFKSAGPLLVLQEQKAKTGGVHEANDTVCYEVTGLGCAVNAASVANQGETFGGTVAGDPVSVTPEEFCVPMAHAAGRADVTVAGCGRTSTLLLLSDRRNPGRDGDGDDLPDRVEERFGCNPNAAETTTVEGRVVDDQGVAVDAADVRILSYGGAFQHWTDPGATSAPDGSFSVPDVPSCLSLRVNAIADPLGSPVPGLSAPFAPVDAGTTNVGDVVVVVAQKTSDGSYETDDGPVAVTSGDVNGDGIPDLVSANNVDCALSSPEDKLLPSTASVLIGGGDGTFDETSLRPEVATSAHDVALADLDLDGNLDIVVVGKQAGVLLGDGLGGFGKEQKLKFGDTAGRDHYGVVLTDVDGDAFPDILTVSLPGQTSILRGLGDGRFQKEEAAAPDSEAIGIAIGDIVEDGFEDILISRTTLNGGKILVAQGDGTFDNSPGGDFETGADSFPRGVALADVDGDDHLDPILANVSDDVTVRLGDGTGTVGPLAQFPAGRDPWRVAVADFDVDGSLDVMASVLDDDDDPDPLEPDQLSLLFGNGDGTFVDGVDVRAGAPDALGGDLVALDLNFDRVPDVAVANAVARPGVTPCVDGTDKVSIRLGNGDGSFRIP